MTYSSALFEREDMSLEEAQRAKYQSICDRMELRQGDHVLEIGCGWGTLAESLHEAGAKVTAISLSDEQLAYARERCSPFITFEKRDYRDVHGAFDAIASCEMVEALGREYWPDFMDVVARNLNPGGRAAIQYISMADDIFEDYASGADFIQAYIFTMLTALFIGMSAHPAH